jgi:hypothetical protein
VFNSTSSFVSAGLLPDTTTLSFVTTFSLDDLSATNPVWHWIHIGDNWSTSQFEHINSVGQTNYQSGFCSSYADPPGTTPQPVDLQGYTLDAIKQYIRDSIGATNTLAMSPPYAAPAAYQQIALQLLGAQIGEQPTGLSITNVAIDPFDTVIVTYQSDIRELYNYCALLGMSQTVTATDTIYAIPIQLVSMQPGMTVGATSTVTYLSDIQTSGSLTISATSRFIPSISLLTAQTNQVSCTGTQQRLTSVYELAYSAVYDDTVTVGPRTAADIGIGPNCYDDSVTVFRFDGCMNYQCLYHIEISSSCQSLNSSGTTFTTCSSQPAEATQHPFTVTVYSCPAGQPSSAACVVGDVPTVVTSSVSLLAFPGVTTNNAFSVNGGLLYSPDETLLSNYHVLSSYDAYGQTSNATTDFDNNQLRNNQSITILEAMSSPTLQQNFDLRITFAGLTIEPLDAFGNPLTTVPALNYSQIAPYLSAISKNQQLLTPSGPLLPLVSYEASLGDHGFDGFSIPVRSLLQLAPANGYTFNVPYTYIIGYGSAVPVEPVRGMAYHSRHLMQATTSNANGASLTTSGTSTFTFQIINDNESDSSDHYWGMTLAMFSLSIAAIGVACLAFCCGGGALLYKRHKRHQYREVNGS